MHSSFFIVIFYYTIFLKTWSIKLCYDTIIKEQKSETSYHKGDTKNGLQQTGIRNARKK